jgi:hypothetical protein
VAGADAFPVLLPFLPLSCNRSRLSREFRYGALPFEFLTIVMQHEVAQLLLVLRFAEIELFAQGRDRFFCLYERGRKHHAESRCFAASHAGSRAADVKQRTFR